MEYIVCGAETLNNAGTQTVTASTTYDTAAFLEFILISVPNYIYNGNPNTDCIS